MCQFGFIFFRVYFFLPVSLSLFYQNISPDFLATIKDSITAYLVCNMARNHFDWVTMKPVPNRKTIAKMVIFLACFIFEDIGQVLLQELAYFDV